jgi:FlaA1/EpsC-like NDP-sugar epimerase/lipopolysaccharide/colanic/teichoic acid biosynthesis glycosyltransferase
LTAVETKIKRLLDILLALVGIAAALPVFPFIALLIKLDSKGPVFYLCNRIGKNGEPFRMYKFRTMVETPACVGTSLSPQGDVRVTSFGRFLRRTKLNEVPQLINILKGEMSFVGPRPEAQDLAELYPSEARILFSVKPGLMGPSQILYRNEEELYPEGADPKDHYINAILPQKLEVDLEYVRQPTILKDIKFILLALKETVFGVISQRHFFENRSQIYLFLLDALSTASAYFLAIQLRYGGTIPVQDWQILLHVFPFLVLCRILCFISLGLYGVLIRYLNIYNYIDIVKAVTLGTLMTVIFIYVIGYSSFPRSVFIIDCFCLNTFMIAVRLPTKLLRDKFYSKETKEMKRVLIFGAGDKGNLTASQLKDRVTIIGFLDDDRLKRNKRIQKYQVLGGRYDIGPLSRIYLIDEVVIAISNLDRKNLDHIVTLCNKASVKYSIFTSLVDSYHDRMREEYIRNRKILQWIGSQELQVDLKEVESFFSEKAVLLIGPGNALGLELLKYLSGLNTREILLLDRYESYLNEILQQSQNYIPKQKVKPIVCEDHVPNSVERILCTLRPPVIIIHMGTRKYPYPMKADPVHIVRENILNTWDLYQLSARGESELFVMTSSVGSAHRPDLIQSTLTLAEHYLQSGRAGYTTRNAVVRLYNLVDNRGSLIREIQNQVKNGRKITLSHPEEERYFFTASAAAKFILLSATMASDGEGKRDHGIYIPILSDKVGVLELTRMLAQHYGLDPDKDLDIEYVGSNVAEEWKENIDFNGQAVRDTAHEAIKKIIPSFLSSPPQIEGDIAEFRGLVAMKDQEGVVRKVKEVLRVIQEAENAETGCRKQGTGSAEQRTTRQ